MGGKYKSKEASLGDNRLQQMRLSWLTDLGRSGHVLQPAAVVGEEMDPRWGQ
jgi:hypothetical protein